MSDNFFFHFVAQNFSQKAVLSRKKKQILGSFYTNQVFNRKATDCDSFRTAPEPFAENYTMFGLLENKKKSFRFAFLSSLKNLAYSF